MTASAAILKAFYGANSQFVAAEQLRHACRATAAVITAEIAALQQLGYQFESHPHFGYRLLAAPDRLTADDLRAQLKTLVIGAEILVFEETASTNDVAGLLAAAGAREGVVVFAESQTKGRGRHGRRWVSPRGKGLWFSVVLRPPLPRSALSRITVAASVAVVRAIRQGTGLDAQIKWPNDVTIGGRKVAGILTEPQAGAAILGVGIDVNCGVADFPSDLSATSLSIETGQPQDRVALATAVLNALDDCYRQALSDFDRIVSEWARRSTTLGRPITIRMGTRCLDGHAQALDGDGALLVRRDNGRIERILGADVLVEK